MSRAVHRSQKRRTAFVVELDSQSALLPALRTGQSVGPTNLLPAAQDGAPQTASQRCALAILLGHSDTLASASAWNESRRSVLLQKRARPLPHMPIAVPGAAPVERSAEQLSTTTEDAEALHATRGASTTAPSNCCRGASIQRTESGPKGSLRQTKLRTIITRDRKDKRWRGPGLFRGSKFPRAAPRICCKRS